MTYQQWEKELLDALSTLSEEEKTAAREYYAELFEDKKEAGEEEEKIVAQFGDPKTVAAVLQNERSEGEPSKNHERKRENEFFDRIQEMVDETTKNAMLAAEEAIKKAKIKIGQAATITMQYDKYKRKGEQTDRKPTHIVYTEDEKTIEQQTHTLRVESYDDIELSFGKTFRVEYDNWTDLSEFTLDTNDGILTLKSQKIKKKFFFRQKGKVLLTLPVDRLLDVCLQADCCNIHAEKGNYRAFYASSDNGRIHVDDSVCEGDFTAVTDNGKIEIGNCQAKNIRLQSDNGAITLRGGKAEGSAKLYSDNGKVEISSPLFAHEIVIKTDNGKIRADGVLTAEDITLKTDNSSIFANVDGKREDYEFHAHTCNGRTNTKSNTGGNKRLTVTTDNGNIEIHFKGGEKENLTEIEE